MIDQKVFKKIGALITAAALIMGQAAVFADGKAFPSITLKLPDAKGQTVSEKTFTNLKIQETMVDAGKLAFSTEALESYKTGKGLKTTDKVEFAPYLSFVYNKAMTDMTLEKQVVAAKLVVGSELTPDKIDAKLKMANSKVDQLKALVPDLLTGGGKETLAKAQAILGNAVSNPQEVLKQFEAAKRQVEALKKQKIAFDAKLKVALQKDKAYTSRLQLTTTIKASQKAGIIKEDLYQMMVSAGAEGFDFTQFNFKGIR